MPDTGTRSAKRPDWDKELTAIADYVCDTETDSELAYETAHYCLMDALACGFQALDYPARGAAPRARGRRSAPGSP